MKLSNVLIRVFAFVLYIIIWNFIFCVAIIGWKEGELSVFKYAYGIGAEYVGVLLAVVVFLSILYLRCFVKKKRNVYVIAYSMTILFLILTIILYQLGSSKLSGFSTEKWIQYPERRISMYFDLQQQYDLKNHMVEDVIELLGTPDNIGADGTYIYDDRHNNYVYVEFENDKVKSISYVE